MATTTSRLRLVAYVRVSTEGQAQDGYGLDAQSEAIASWAQRHGHKIVRTCCDEGVSGTVEALDREGLSCAIDAIETGQADALVIPRLDRLARALTVQEAVLSQIWTRGGRIFCVDSGEVLPNDPDEPIRTAMRLMAGVFAELDRAQINKRLRDGRRLKAARGGYVAGSPPYGLRAEGGELVPDPTEQSVLERMIAMRKAGSTLASIAATLNDDGIPSKRGGSWSPSSVSRVIDPAARERARRSTEIARRRFA